MQPTSTAASSQASSINEGEKGKPSPEKSVINPNPVKPAESENIEKTSGTVVAANPTIPVEAKTDTQPAPINVDVTVPEPPAASPSAATSSVINESPVVNQSETSVSNTSNSPINVDVTTNNSTASTNSSEEIINNIRQRLDKIKDSKSTVNDLKNTSVKSWEKWSPVFVVDAKKTGNPLFPLVYYAVNFNFIPLQIRSEIFDPYFTEEIFEKNIPLKVNRMGMEKELLKWGFEYSIRSYNAIQLNLVHKIDMNFVPRFLMSGHPRATYDPKKLMEIWKEKIKTRDERHNEMMQSLLTDFYEMDGQIKEKYKVLKGHIQNIQNSLRNFKK